MGISIHTSLTGSDSRGSFLLILQFISIHTSLTGSDVCLSGSATAPNISIHTSLTGSDKKRLFVRLLLWEFQSTLPSREVTAGEAFCLFCNLFQSTLPSREVTYVFPVPRPPQIFQSTLPSREVTHCKSYRGSAVRFQSTLPSREVTVECIVNEPCNIIFQSTLPSREVTGFLAMAFQANYISIHTSLTGSDQFSFAIRFEREHFNPHFPHGK